MQEEVINLYSPVVGIMLDIMQVPDPVFAEKMVGDGIAIDPLVGKIYAPINGVIKSVHQSKHAIIIRADAGFDILVHIGLDTVALDGSGFNIYVSDGDRIEQGNMIGEFDLDYISQRAKTLITPIVLIDLDRDIFSFSVNRQYETNLTTPILSIKKNISDKNTQSDIRKSDLIKSPPVIIKNPHGIHARPAANISSCALSCDGEVYLEKSGMCINAKSIINILGLAVGQNEIVYVYANSQEVIDKITNIINNTHDVFEECHAKTHHFPLRSVEGSKYYGVSASTGTVCGTLVKRNKLNFVIEENSTDKLVERNRFYDALATVKKEIEYNLKGLVDDDHIYKGILEAYIQILSDPKLTQDCLAVINQNKTAAYAVNKVFEDSCNLIAKSNNSLINERQSDFRDLCHRLLSAMDKIEVKPINFAQPTILLADELTPTDLIKIDENLVGLISVHGGVTSHVAIIARARGIPFLIGVDNSILNIDDDIQVVINCKDRYVDVAPTDEEIQEAKNTYITELNNKREAETQDLELKSQTMDGYHIKCSVNITSIAESENIINNGASGIGLFRTEFIFFGRRRPPSMEEQHKIYFEIAANIGDAPFVIRTLDAGGEKKISYLKLPREENPVLGLRGIRVSLERKDLLIAQLTAIAMINKPNIKIMIPMISSIEEYREVKFILDEIKVQHNISANIELGIMVEVPSVALLSDIFAKEVDFFSIGTNDLSQYILAIAREHSKLAKHIDHLHPAVVRNIDLVVKGAKTMNRPVSVCGLMASERLAIPLLIGLGVDELSMGIDSIKENRAFISNLNYTDCVDAAKECLQLATASEIRQYLSERFINKTII